MCKVEKNKKIQESLVSFIFGLRSKEGCLFVSGVVSGRHSVLISIYEILIIVSR